MQPDETRRGINCVPWNDDGELKVLIFDLAGQSVALEAALVREILDMMPATPVPGAPALVASVVNFRGRIIPLADLRVAFGMASSAATIDSRIVVIEIDLGGAPTIIGLRTDKVHEVATFAIGASEETPVVGLRWRRDHVRALVRHGADDIVVLPDLQAVFEPILRGDHAAGHSIH